MSRTRARGTGSAGVAALAGVLALTASTLSACTWDPHAAQRSASSSGTATGPSTPSATSVSHEVEPSGTPAEPSATNASSAPSSAPSSSASPGATRPGHAASGASGDPFGHGTGGPRPAPDRDVAGTFDPALPTATGAGTGDEVGTLADVTVSVLDGFDRVVLELDGPDVPAWEVRYVPRALRDPNGERVDVDGDAVLQVLLHPIAHPDGHATAYSGPSAVSRAGSDAVAQVVVSSFFDGELQAFVGVHDGRLPFRVYGMTDPARVVVEVARP